MSTDRELLELAAKAAGIVESKGPLRSGLGILVDNTPPQEISVNCAVWNPLTDDGDALRLAVKLHLIVCSHEEESWAQFYLSAEEGWATFKELHAENEYAATRRAIVRAAAEIGKHSAPSDSGREGS